MSQAYTPGLLVTGSTEIEKLRELPLPGEALVKPGDAVKAADVVLRAMRPGELDIVRIADRLGVEPEDAVKGMWVKSGDQVRSGDVLCEIKTFFGWFTARVESPASGTIEFFTEANAHIGIRGPATALDVTAFIDGTVAEVEEGKSVTIKNHGAVIQGIFGVGGERLGTVTAITGKNDQLIEPQDIQALGPRAAGAVIVGGRSFSSAALNAAASAGAAAVVTGSIDSAVLAEFVGYQIGVSITGDEDVPLTLIITEGFGDLPISDRVVELARSIDGRRASVSGATQVRAGAMRPEVLCPGGAAGKQAEAVHQGELSIGKRVRIIRVPHFGKFAEVQALPAEPQLIPTGASVRVLRLKLEESGESVIVPRANVELT